MTEYSTSINGIDIKAEFSDEAINGIYLPLLKRLTDIQKAKNRRILVMLAAPPGAGKTTLVSFLEHLSNNTEEVSHIQGIGMDGFHRRQEYLLSSGGKLPMYVGFFNSMPIGENHPMKNG